MLGCLLASCAVHAAVALYVGTSPAFQVFVSEIGRNSVAMISSQGNNVPPNDMEVILETAELSVTAESVQAKSPYEVSDQRAPASGDVKKQQASAAEIIARRDNSPEKTEQPIPAPLPQEIERVELEEQPVPATPPRLERSKLDPETKPEEALVSAASIASLGSEPSRGADVDRPPRPVVNPAPEYPASALSNRQTGLVKLRVRVGSDGRVLAASVYTSSGVAELDAAALQAVRGWQFESAMRGGAAVEQEIAVPVNFVLAPAKR